MSARFYLTIGLVVAGLVFGGWRTLSPSSNAKQVGDAVSSVLDTMTRAQFTGAQATLDAQRNATGSYEGAPLTAPMTLIRADANTYCIQFAQGTIVRHLAGPGGTPQAGPC